MGQYTGLKDKKGKEIYEGDICETVTYSGKPFGTIDVVKFSGGAFKLTDIEDALLPIPLDDSDIQSVEVIGNIFEHPHLIGGKHG
ncbi:YopX family protein [Oceanobacillus caeni]|nr:YopX family protein [Oceanobacillus caeni]